MENFDAKEHALIFIKKKPGAKGKTLEGVMEEFESKVIMMRGKRTRDWNLKIQEYYLDIQKEAWIDIFKKPKEDVLLEEQKQAQLLSRLFLTEDLVSGDCFVVSNVEGK